MYSRSYYPEEQERLIPPQNYDGTAFVERTDQYTDDPPAPEQTDVPTGKPMRDTGGLFSGLDRIPILSSIFGGDGIFGKGGLGSFNIGTEEILIIATAAFLFFSKSGDRECAIILLILLFIR